jgi:hypothetical protein
MISYIHCIFENKMKPLKKHTIYSFILGRYIDDKLIGCKKILFPIDTSLE